MEPNTVKATDSQRLQPPLILKPAELALDRGALSVGGFPALRIARDQRVQPVGSDPR
jgi:hypothetical protein